MYDIAIIGAGPGGYVAAVRAAQLGLKTVCIDKRDTVGGTCLNVGCIPSKALLYSTELYRTFQHDAKAHGIGGKPTLDFSQMMSRKEGIVKGLVDGVAGLFKQHGIDFVKGEARFVTSTKLEVSQGGKKQEIEARHTLIATGSAPIALPGLVFDEKRVLSSTGALSLPEIPANMVVIGGGVIGVELASVYSRLGTKVTVVEMLDHICPAMDDAISRLLLQVLKKQGLEFLLSTTFVDAKVGRNEVVLNCKQGDKAVSLNGDVVLVAVGRRPYTQGLNLEGIGITVTPRGFVNVDGKFRTTQPNIYAIGDVIEGTMLAHLASDEGVAAVEIIAGQNPRINYMAIPNVIYTSPEVAAVGFSEKEAKDAGLAIKVGASWFKANPRARCMGQTDGLVKIIGEARTGRVIGLHILGAEASELIAEGVLAIEKKATLHDVAYASHAHPTLSESIKEAAQNALLK